MKNDGWFAALLLLAIVGGGLYYQRDDDGSTSSVGSSAPLVPDRSRGCRSLEGPLEQRVKACFDELGKIPLGGPAREQLDSLGKEGLIAILGGTVQHEQAIPVDPMGDLGKALLGTDEGAAADMLGAKNVRGLVVHRDLTNATDRDAVVLARLAHHDYLERFQLRRVTAESFIYSVRSEPARISEATGASMLAGLRERISGVPYQPQRWKPSNLRIIGSMRLQGNTLVQRYASGNDIEAVLDELAGDLSREWERNAAPEGHGLLANRLDDIRIEIQVIMERAPVEPRGRHAIFDLWELGVDGMMFSQREGVQPEKFTYMPGSEAVTRSIRTADEFLHFATDKGGWHDERPWEQDPRTRLDLIRTQHFMEAKRGGGGAVRLFRGMPEETMEDLTDEKLQQMLIDGGEWWLRNMNDDGSVLYKYWPTQNRESDDYNEVRHILAARDLADTWRYRHDDRYLAGSRANMDWLLQYEVKWTDPPHPALPHPPEGSILFRYPDRPIGAKVPNQKLGTVAVAILGWIAWADSTGSHAEDERIRQMARFVVSQQNDDGKFEPYYVPSNHPYYGNRNDIVPGEAALALGMVAEYFKEPQWLEFFPKFLDFYEPWFRERAARVNPYGRWPHDTYDNDTRLDLVQFGPWAIMACKQYYIMTGDERAARFGLEIADWMIDSYEWTDERSPFPDYVGGYYKMPEELPAMQSFCYSEGTAAAYRIASQFAPERKDKYDQATRETLRFLRLMQFDDVDAYFAADPEIIHGGVKYAMNENKVRIDYVGHALSTISQYLDARRDDPAVSLAIRQPDTW